MFDADLAGKVEEYLRLLVCDLKGVRNMSACSRTDLKIYRISFGYQRKHPLQNYLLMYDPQTKIITGCAEGGFGYPPHNVRKRLLERLGGEGYEEQAGAYCWNNIDLENLITDGK